MGDTSKLQAPGLDSGIPAPWSDLSGFAVTFVMLVTGTMVLIGAIGLAQSLYNQFIASNTPDEIGSVEVV